MSNPELVAASAPPVYELDVRDAFVACSDDEKLYIHHMSRAAYHGARIILQQVSPESEKTFELLLELVRSCEGDWDQFRINSKASAQEVNDLLDFGATFLDSIGNYRGNGDSKIIPRLSYIALQRCCQVSHRAALLFESVKASLFSSELSTLGFPDQHGASGYFLGSPAASQSEIEIVQNFLLERGHLLENTRLQKNVGDSVVFTILVASVSEYPTDGHFMNYVLPNHEGRIQFAYGDHSKALKHVVEHLEKATEYAQSDEQKAYIQGTAEHFLTGSMQAHKDASIAWLRDEHPRVETLIGFIESYRDPTAVRGEFEGLVAIQNIKFTRQLKALAVHGKSAVQRLPWCQPPYCAMDEKSLPFENSVFICPDFVSLDVLSFCASAKWIGISAPNYKDIKTKYGRKNVSFANRSAAVHLHDHTPFVKSEHQEEYRKWKHIVFRVIVGIHELIGHGCGRLLAESAPGVFNFDRNNLPINPLTGKAIGTWYKVGQTPKSLFGGIATSYSECFAELVALYLMPEQDLLDAMEISASELEKDDVVFNAYLQMISMGLRGMLSYNPTKQRWGQPHDQARFAIVKYLCSLVDQSGRNVLQININPEAESGALDLSIDLDKDLLDSTARPGIGRICLELHIRRCIADVEGGTALYQDLTRLDETHLKWRAAVLAHQQPRPLFLMSNTVLEDGNVHLKSYPATSAGIMQSWYERDV